MSINDLEMRDPFSLALERQTHANGLLRERIAQLESELAASKENYENEKRITLRESREDLEHALEQRDQLNMITQLQARVTELARNAEADQKHIDALRDERNSWIRKAEEASRNYEALQEEREALVAENRKLWARVHAAQNVLAGQSGGGS